MDPFVQIESCGQTLKTAVHDGGGKTPKWTDKLVLVSVSDDVDVEITVWDKDPMTNDVVAKATLNSKELITKDFKKWIPLMHKNKKAGELLIETTWEEDLEDNEEL
jgi:hypothetical protein